MRNIRLAKKTVREEGLVTLLKKTARVIIRDGIRIILLPFYQKKIDKLKNEKDWSKTLAFALDEHNQIIKPMQIASEIKRLLELLAGSKPRYVLEIGTANGGTLLLFARAAAKDATIISIDLPGGDYGGGYSGWRVPLYKKFASEGQKLHLLRRDSHTTATKELVQTLLETNMLDFLFIDGDHSYEGVKRDFQLYQDLVREGGIIALHDIAIHPPQSQCDVNKFWNEIKDQYQGVELIEDVKQGSCGIGYIIKK